MSQLPILMVPGLGCTAEVFVPQLPALWPFGPLTIASTLEGDSMAAIAAGILATAPPRFALGGISMGGYLCFEILRQAPERVVKLALLDTSARPDRPEQSALRRTLVARARKGELEAAAKEAFPGLVHPDHKDDATLAALSLRMNLAIGVEGFARQQGAIIARPDSRPGLGSIHVPTLVLVGDADQLTPPELAQEIAAGIAGSRLVVVPGSGHMSTWEQSDAVNEALVDWLQDG
ncbi:MAG: alpha/beta fold hydrolase [Devosia sp.]|nr:alpha/beta fold hydrolase [Devosia sp.]